MRLRELFENIYEQVPEAGEEHDGGLKTIGICYGRWNPPHRGHRDVWKSASKNPIWFVGTNENTEGPKDPLPYEVKLQCMAAVWPGVAGHVIPEQDLFVMATNIYEKYGENVHLNVYTDEEWLASSLLKYNGMMNQKHGGYKFTQIDWKKTERKARATDLRAYVRAGNKQAFYKDAGIPATSMITIGEKAYPLFDIVSHYLNKYPEKVTKNAAKATVAEATRAKITHRQSQASRGISTYGDAEKASGDYVAFKLGQAMACTDGTNTPDMDAKSWHGKRKTVHPYTDVEQQMFIKAAKVVGADVEDVNHGDMRSLELDTTNKTSPVAKTKKNKYGV
jgi:hypothetical protein